MLKVGHNIPLALRLTVHSTSSFVVKILGLTPDGPFVFERETTGDLTRETQDFQLPEIPIMVSITTDDTAVVRGDIYAKLELLLNGTPYFVLTSGYVTALSGPSWPNGKIEESTSGRGKTTVITGTDQDAGNEISEAVPSNVLWLLRGLRLRLTTDLNSGTRVVHVVLGDGTNTFADIIINKTQSLNNSRDYTFLGVGDSLDQQEADDLWGSWPNNILLPAGFTIATDTTSFKVGDNWTAPLLYVEQWILPA